MVKQFKGTVHPKMEILSSVTYSQVALPVYISLFWLNTEKDVWKCGSNWDFWDIIAYHGS